MFKKLLPPDKHLPVLNLPPANPPATPTPEASTSSTNGPSTSAEAKNRRPGPRGVRRARPATANIEERHIQFHSFENFAISTKGINKLCEEMDSDGLDVHFVFNDDFSFVPRLGLSCLSLQQLFSDGVKLQGEGSKPEELCFIKLLDLIDENKEPIGWSFVEPRRGQTLTVSLDLAIGKDVRVRFTFEGERPTPWYSLAYLPYLPDYSLVLEITKSDVFKPINNGTMLRPTLHILTTFGWLKWHESQAEEEAGERGEERPPARMLNTGEVSTELAVGECIYCYEPGSDTMFFPCCHLSVHRTCVPATIWTDNNKKCPTCQQKCTKLVTVRHRLTTCYFCGPDSSCRVFNTFFDPCGCSIGCLEGFRRQAQEMGLNCMMCGATIQNLLQIFVTNAD